MRRLDVQIPAPDGCSSGTLHVPDGGGPWPGVLVFPDAGGVRETFGQMGDRLADTGYVALIPDIYYRAGGWAPFDMATLFTDPPERARMGTLMRVLTNDRIIADAGAYSDFLLARPEVTGPAIGTTGYCLGGRLSLIAAEGLGRTIAAAASFHGGRLAVADDPSSPHLLADRITARVYVAGAKDDNSFTAGQAQLLEPHSVTPEWTTPSSSTPPTTDLPCPTTPPTTGRPTPGTGKHSTGSTGPASSARAAAAASSAAQARSMAGCSSTAAGASPHRGGIAASAHSPREYVREPAYLRPGRPASSWLKR
jgi:carboxymethylenebutenolidase